MKYIIIVDYESDAERKRIDYVIERWVDKLKISKPKGTIILVNGESRWLQSFLEDLYSRLEVSSSRDLTEKIKVFRAGEYTPEIEENRVSLVYTSKGNIETIKKFLEYLMARINASYEYSTGYSRVYRAYTKKGWAKIEVGFKDKGEENEVIINIEGYGDVVDFISNKIDKDMKSFLGVV